MVSDWENRVARGDHPAGPMTPSDRDEICQALAAAAFTDDIVFASLRSAAGTEREMFVAMVLRLVEERRELKAQCVELVARQRTILQLPLVDGETFERVFGKGSKT